jgi:hypothetical protein
MHGTVQDVSRPQYIAVFGQDNTPDNARYNLEECVLSFGASLP